jgi:lipid-A-disaccharide synthase-like uncharacterized protein
MLLHTKNLYILKLLLKVVTAGTDELSGNKFLFACVKEVCHLWAQSCFDTLDQLLVIIEELWSQPVLQVGKQVVVTQSKVRAVRRAVKQLLVEMFQQCSSVSSCMRTCSHGGALHQMLAFHAFCSEWPYAVFLVFCNILLTLVRFFVAWIPPSENRKQLPSAFWHAHNVCPNFFSFFGEHVFIHCFDCSLVSTFTNKTYISSPVTRTVWLRNASPSLWYRSKHSQSQSHSLSFVCTFRTHLEQNLW